MKEMKILKEDILKDIDPDRKTVILHGANCSHTMGAGVAKYLATKYPLVLAVDKAYTTRGDRTKLGRYTTAEIRQNFHILNCYTQFRFRSPLSSPNEVFADYGAIRSCLQMINRKYDGWEIRSVKIGCGLARGDWEIVKGIFEQELIDQEVKIYEK